MTNQDHIEFEKEFSDKLTVHKNLKQEVVVTTIDKIRICLMQNKERLTVKNGWIAPLGILITLVATLFSTNFKTFIFKAEVWQAVYIIGTLITVVWLIVSIKKAWPNRDYDSVDAIISELTNAQPVFDLQKLQDFFSLFKATPANTDKGSDTKPIT